MTRALFCLEAVQQCPRLVWQVEARCWMEGSHIRMLIDHSSWQPGLLHTALLCWWMLLLPRGADEMWVVAQDGLRYQHV